MRWRDFYRERRHPNGTIPHPQPTPTEIAKLVRDWLEQEANSGNFEFEIEPAALNYVADLFHDEAFYVD